MSKAERAAAQAAAADGRAAAVRVLKKYPNRRLYDTQSSSYITLADVKQMVLDSVAFEVRDAKSGEDLTRAILLQIILEEETGGMPMFSTGLLAQMIRGYGHAMQGMLGSYLEHNMKLFAEMQERLVPHAGAPLPFAPPREAWNPLLAAQAPAAMQQWFNTYLEQSRQMMEQMQAGNPFVKVAKKR